MDDDNPELPSDTLKILEEFLKEKSVIGKTDPNNEDIEFLPLFNEDWQLSQFWYDDKTAEVLVEEAIKSASPAGRIACVSCPTIYHRLKSLNLSKIKVYLLEFDKRFEHYGCDFIFYDYNEPLKLEESLKQSFDIVLADPPFLSNECLENFAKTIKYLAKEKIILCTGLVMKSTIEELLNLQLSNFKPSHARKLGNEFACFTNYKWYCE